MYSLSLLHVTIHTFKITLHASWHLYSRAKPKGTSKQILQFGFAEQYVNIQHYPVPHKAMKSEWKECQKVNSNIF